MVRGRTTAPAGMVLGHEITGPSAQEAPMDMWIWVGGSAGRPSTCWCLTPISTC
jgi:hypothetical protein